MPTPYDKEHNWFLKIRFTAIVPRWSVVPVVNRQDNGQHSYLVACYAEKIAVALGQPIDMGALLSWALAHDQQEARYGDLPAGTDLNIQKPRNDEDIDPEVVAIVRAADRFEAYFYAIGESRLGNSYMEEQLDDLLVKALECLDQCTGNRNKVMEVISG